MDTRLAIITGSMFGGVLLAGAVVADPGLVGSLNPGSIASAAGNVFHLGDREGDEHDEYEDDEDDRDEHGQFNPQNTVDFRAPAQQTTTDTRSREEREHSRGPSSIVVNPAGQGSSHEQEEEDD